jgi:glycosyltransferase involved in cell wall biosynthesis
MSDVRFSIVIPTRNRFETLESCVKTCLKQEGFINYEIIVSDNSDDIESAETKNCINNFQSDKIRYFKTPEILSMTANYEFALSKCKGEYIICIGDDDGIVPNSLSYINELIIKFNAQVVKGPIIIYHWKNALQNPNVLGLPFPNPVVKIDSRSMLEKVARFELGYFNLPMIYYSFVSKKIVDQVIVAQGSFFGNAASIDMYSGFVIAHQTLEYILSDLPFVIMGVSGKSNGASEVQNLQTSISKEHYAKTGLVEMYRTYQVPQLPNYNLQLLSLLELKKFKKNFQLSDDELYINTKKVIAKFLSKSSILNNRDNLGIAECFRKYDIYKTDVQDVEKEFFHKEFFFPFLEDEDIQMIRHMFINPDHFGIENVFDAAITVKNIFDGYGKVKPVPIQTVPELKKKDYHKKTPFFKKYYKRVKQAGKILLRGYE